MYEHPWASKRTATRIASHHAHPKGKRYLYSTVKRGKVKVTSQKQHRLLHGRKLPHTHVYQKDGKIVRERWTD